MKQLSEIIPDLYIELKKEAMEIYEWLDAVVVREAFFDKEYQVVMEPRRLYEFAITFYRPLSVGGLGCMFDIQIAVDSENNWTRFIGVYNWAMRDKLNDRDLKHEAYVENISDLYRRLKIIWDVRNNGTN